jgi:hypothetical protein
MKRLNASEITALVGVGTAEQCDAAINIQYFKAQYAHQAGMLTLDWTVETVDEGLLVNTTLCGFNAPGLPLNGAHYAFTHYESRQQVLSGGLQVITYDLPAGATAYLDCVVYDVNLTTGFGCRTEIPVTVL